MYEARQNKEKVSRRIDVAGCGKLQRMRINDIRIMQKFNAVHLSKYPKEAQNFRRQNPQGGNIAYFYDNPQDNYRGNSLVHSEEKMLDEIHRTRISNTTTKITGSVVDDKLSQLDGKRPQRKNIFTVNYPCKGNWGANFNCDRLLNKGLTSDSVVYYVYNTKRKNEKE